MGASRNLAIGALAASLLLALAVFLSPAGAQPQRRAPIMSASPPAPARPATAGAKANGTIVRQDELRPGRTRRARPAPTAAPGGCSPSRAPRRSPRRLGIGEAASAPMCLGCHATPAAPGARGAALPGLRRGRLRELPRRRLGLAGEPLRRRRHPRRQRRRAASSRSTIRAPAPAVCLDCHFGSAEPRPVRQPPDHGRRPPAHRLRARPVHDAPAASRRGRRLCRSARAAPNSVATLGGRPGDGAASARSTLFADPGSRHRGDVPRILFLRLPHLPPPDLRRPALRADQGGQSRPADPVRHAALQ